LSAFFKAFSKSSVIYVFNFFDF
ncbi:uncharacterized protein METZ01_LOCUS463660, partial [marine metagenome]